MSFRSGCTCRVRSAGEVPAKSSDAVPVVGARPAGLAARGERGHAEASDGCAARLPAIRQRVRDWRLLATVEIYRGGAMSAVDAGLSATSRSPPAPLAARRRRTALPALTPDDVGG